MSEREDTPIGSEVEAVAEAQRQLSEPVDEMKAAILKLSRESNIIEHGLTESKPEAEDDTDYSDSAVQRELLEEGQRLLADSGHTAAKQRPSPEAAELLAEATEREMQDGYSVEAGLRHAERDREGFFDLMEAAIEADPEIEEILEQFGAVSLEDLPSSDAFMQLSAEEQQQVREEIYGSPAFAYAREVLDGNRADGLASKQHALRETQERALGADAELWGRRVIGALGARGLTPDKLDGALAEIEAFQRGLAEAGPEFLETLLGDDFDPANPADRLLYESLLVPLDERPGNDPDLPLEAQALQELVGRLGRAQASRSEQAKLLAAAGHRHLPLEDDAREAYLENWGGLPAKPLLSKKELLGILRGGPHPNRTGQQAARDLVSNSTNLRNRGELERVRNAHDAAYARDLERRRRHVFGA